MSQPKPFQQSTIDAALLAFDTRPVRRFLVADEAGLGKTIVAQGILRTLMQRRQKNKKGPLRVFYICSSLAIASQNRSSLLKALDDESLRSQSSSKVDRLTLIPIQTISPDTPLHLYTLTPDTSMPDRRGKQRSGTVFERALLYNLLDSSSYSALIQMGQDKDGWLQQNAKVSWEKRKQDSKKLINQSMIKDFFAALRNQLQLESGQHIPSAFKKLFEDHGPLEVIKRMRMALALAGLKQVSPDLVILDEFQRFQDLLGKNSYEEGHDERVSEIAQEILHTGQDGPAVLLLSATPYRSYGGDLETAFNEGSHHKEFFLLVQWLFGMNDDASNQRQKLEAAFQEYGHALRSTDPTGRATQEAKEKIETMLSSIMARSERFDYQVGHNRGKTQQLLASLIPADLYAYRHLVDCFRTGDTSLSGATISSAVTYWNSVPLPMQFLGPDYQPWKKARMNVTSRPGIQLRRQEVAQFKGPKAWPHPRIRALGDHLDAARLAVPWLAPSLPWWKLEGPWAHNPPEKILLFSRFRASPRSIAGLLSYDVERHLLGNSNIEFQQVTKKTLLRPSPDNLALFHPSPVLAELIDPTVFQVDSSEVAMNVSIQKIRQALISKGVRVTDGGTARRPSELVVLLERRWEKWDESLGVWHRLANNIGRTTSEGGKGLSAIVDAWDKDAKGTLDIVTNEEVAILARMALAAPGVILIRALGRHGLDPIEHLYESLSTSWEGLRSYLNNPWMDAALPGNGKDYSTRIMTAILAGNLESVLDEHLWITALLRDPDPLFLAKQLTVALSLRTSNVTLHNLGRSPSFTLRAHAALPFSEVRKHHPEGSETEEASVRTDDLRIAFNSPFWPYVLASTSVGQEGLDFHVWCNTILHWDLPGNPMDLEQREGRIDRYGGLSIRRALARSGRRDDCSEQRNSPWCALAQKADENAKDGSGLAPWWICEGALVKRLVFDLPLSEANAHFARLQQERLLYRLALGQPDQHEMVKALHNLLTMEQVEKVSINLSPWVRQRPRPEIS